MSEHSSTDQQTDQQQTSSEKLPLAICLMGPTASGKTDLAMQLVDHYPCEIISVDSAMVYRGMDIGTAKPTAEELAKYPHRLVDICDPSEVYSAAEFRRDALEAMAEITAAGRIPLLTGGTMLYFKALIEGLADMPAANAEIRQQIEADAASQGWPHVHARLAKVDPESAARIHPHHSQRLERALEVYLSSGVTMTEWHRRQRSERPAYRFLQLAIAPFERTVLHQRIAKRFHLMMEQGLLDEVRALRDQYELQSDLPAMRSVGYRQVWQYLEGEVDDDTMIERGIVATRQLAKRQFTWLRGWPGLHWLYTDDAGLLLDCDANNSLPRGFAGQPPLALVRKYLASQSAAGDDLRYTLKG